MDSRLRGNDTEGSGNDTEGSGNDIKGSVNDIGGSDEIAALSSKARNDKERLPRRCTPCNYQIISK